jgi:hypothetical protein
LDGRDIRAKTRFALLPGHDDVDETGIDISGLLGRARNKGAAFSEEPRQRSISAGDERG